MSKFLAGLSGGSGLGVAGAVGVVVVAAGAWVQFGSDRADPTAPVAAALPVVQTDETPEVSAEPEVVAVPEKVEEAAVPDEQEPVEEAAVPAEQEPVEEAVETATIAPAFDEVRRESDGMTVIAGRAEPGATISILQNGTEIATSTVDGSGKFATLAMIPPDGQGHVLTLLQILGEVSLPSDEQIILAPIEAPVVAEAEIEQEADVQEETAPLETAVLTPEVNTPSETLEPATEVEQPEAAAVETASVEPEVEAEVAEVAVSEEPAPETTEAAPEPKVETPVATADVTSEPEATEPEQPARVAVLKTTSEGVELLNPDAPEVMDNVAIDTISYSTAGAVQLAGRAQGQAEAVRIYLDNNAVVSLPVDDQGRWRGDLPEVDEGIYTLRVDEVAGDGSVTSRVETPFKREAAATLAAASAAQDGPIKAITVQKGATLWAIARERYGSGDLYVRVFEANRASIKNADLIYPGQIFDLPD